MRLLFALSLSLLAFGCSSKEGKPCPADGSCGDELRCEPVTKTCQSICGKPADCKKGLTCNEPQGVCFSQKAAHNRMIQEICDKMCWMNGMCSAVDGKCIATKDEHCAKSQLCIDEGKCSAVNGECKPTKAEHCLNTQACKADPDNVWGGNKCSFADGKCL